MPLLRAELQRTWQHPSQPTTITNFPPRCFEMFNHSQPLALIVSNPLFLQNSFHRLPEGDRERLWGGTPKSRSGGPQEQTRPLPPTHHFPQDEISGIKAISVLFPLNSKPEFPLKKGKGRAGQPTELSLACQGCILPHPGKFSPKTPSSSASAAADEQRCLSRPACGIRIQKCTPAPRDFTDLLSVKGNNH